MEPSKKRPPHPQVAVSRAAHTATRENGSPDHYTQSLALEDGKPPHEQATYDFTRLNRRINAADVRKLCGGISDMTLWRWLQSEELQFPRPIYIGRRRYWKESEIFAWLQAQSQKLPCSSGAVLETLDG